MNGQADSLKNWTMGNISCTDRRHYNTFDEDGYKVQTFYESVTRLISNDSVIESYDIQNKTYGLLTSS